jgi:hypothetical protein
LHRPGSKAEFTLGMLEPTEGIEPTTAVLQMRSAASAGVRQSRSKPRRAAHPGLLTAEVRPDCYRLLLPALARCLARQRRVVSRFASRRCGPQIGCAGQLGSQEVNELGRRIRRSGLDRVVLSR